MMIPWGRIAMVEVMVGMVLFALLAYPLWAFINCCSSPSFSALKKFLWGLVMLCVWPFGSWIYGIVAARDKNIRYSAWGILVFLLVMIFAIAGMLAQMLPSFLGPNQMQIYRSTITERWGSRT